MLFEDPYDPTPTPKLLREQCFHLFQQMHQSPAFEDMDRAGIWRRASGFMKCGHCRLPYRDHPLYDEYLFGDPWIELTDHRLCNGDVIHP